MVMAWRISIGFVVLAQAIALASASSEARADEAYLCGPDRIVYVAVADLEAKKRSDPCIAAYFGLSAETVVKTVSSAAVAPEWRTTTIKIETELKTPAPELPDRAPAARQQQAALSPAVLAQGGASPGTDFRNVRVINAAASDAAWFRHSN